MRPLRHLAATLALALLALPARADLSKPLGIGHSLSEDRPGKLLVYSPSTLRLNVPFLSSGPSIADDANTVAHVTWDPWQIASNDPQPTFSMRGIVWAAEQSQFVISGYSVGVGTILTSPDGFTWTTRAVPATAGANLGSNFGVIHWNGTNYVAISNAGGAGCITSTDGVNWTRPTGAAYQLTGTIYAIAWDGTRRVAVGPSNILTASSANPCFWTQTDSTGIGWTGVAYSPTLGLFAAAGPNTIWTSPTGAAGTWTSRTVPAVTWQAITWGSDRFVALSSGSTSGVYSTNGTTWNTTTTPNTANNFGVIWNGTFFFAGGTNGDAITSTDGITWTTRESTYTITGVSGSTPMVAWNGTRFVMVNAHASNTPKIVTATVAEALALPGALVDSKSNAWAMTGTVPIATSPLYPDGFTSPAKSGAGPFADANYFSLGTGSDVLDFAGDFSACVTFQGADTYAALPYLFENGSTGSNSGYAANFSGTGGFGFYSYLAATNLFAPNLAISRAAEAVCFGRAGTTRYVKLDLGAIASDAGAAWAVGTTIQARIGRGTAASRPYPSGAYELWFSTTTPSDALFTAIQNRFFQHVAATGQTLTVSRSTIGSAEPVSTASPSLYYWPSNTLRITENGALIETAATNIALQSEALDTSPAPWAVTVGGTGTLSVTANTTVAPDGATSAETLTFGSVAGAGNFELLRQSFVSAAGNTPFTASVWLKAGTATGVRLRFTDNAGVRASTLCTLSATWTRCTATGTTAAIITGVTLDIGADGNAGESIVAGTVIAWGAQLEQGVAFPSSYTPTTTVAVARGADSASVANPLPVGPFCTTGTFTPAPPSTWASVVRDLWAFGTPGGVNSTRVQVPTIGSIIFQVIDGAGGSKAWTVAAGTLTGSAAHTITACSDNAGTGSVTLDGVLQSVVVSGAGTGALSIMDTISLSPTAGGTLAAAAVKNFKVCKGSNPAKCQ